MLMFNLGLRFTLVLSQVVFCTHPAPCSKSHKFWFLAMPLYSIKYESATDLISFEKVTASFISKSVTSLTWN
jgi:hypothetical protein